MPTEDKGDFILTISVEETAVPQGEAWWVSVELKNQSGRDLKISVSMLFWPPMIPSWHPPDIDWPLARTVFFPKNGVIRREPGGGRPFDVFSSEFGVGGDSGYGEMGIKPLPVGKHELRFRARFVIIHEHEEENQQIEVWSNTVLLTVLPSRL
jgi:hypothetical protein